MSRHRRERWLVTGAGGQLGSDLVLALDGADVVGLARAELDLGDADAVAKAVADVAPDVVVNAAAYTAVDAAETDEAAAHLVNAVGPGHLAASCAESGARLVHVSTDYVFDGEGTRPYETDDPTGPRSAYGRTKLAGEQAVLTAGAGSVGGAYVVRTAWVYGATGSNFVKTMVRLEGERLTVDVVDDQRGSPTWSADLARGLVELGRSDARPGIYHCSNAGAATWCDLAKAVFAELGTDPARVRPTTSAAFERPAPRPGYSVLSDRAWVAAGLTRLPDWRETLHVAFDTVGDQFRAGRPANPS